MARSLPFALPPVPPAPTPTPFFVMCTLSLFLYVGESEPVPLSELEGRIAAVSVIPYPPGTSPDLLDLFPENQKLTLKFESHSIMYVRREARCCSSSPLTD